MPTLTRADLQRRALANGASIEFDDGDMFNAEQQSVPVVRQSAPAGSVESSGSTIEDAIAQLTGAMTRLAESKIGEDAAVLALLAAMRQDILLLSVPRAPAAYRFSVASRDKNGFIKDVTATPT